MKISKPGRGRQYTQGRKRVTRKDNGYFLDEVDVIYRSSYELKAIDILTKLYHIRRIKEWKYETDVFQYESSVDGTTHKYFMDFTLVMNDGRVFYIEVKPYHETIPPKKGATENQILTYVKNQDKWNAVKEYCKRKNRELGKEVFHFVIWSEDHLNISKQSRSQKYYKRKNSKKKKS